MQPVERVNLKHVLQTVCVLEAVVLRSFGPDGGQVLFTRDTGQLMLSRSGKRILTALRLDHPLARMVVECAWKHSEVTGDGSKTFVLLLAALLRGIQTEACEGSVASRACMARARHTAEELLAFGLEELGDIIGAKVVPHSVNLSWESIGGRRDEEGPPRVDANADDACDVRRLLAAFFDTRLGCTHSRLMSRLTRDLISLWRRPTDPPSLALRFLEKNLTALHTPVCGFPARCCRLIEGQVIHRDFAPSVLSDGVVLEVGGREGYTEGGIMKYSVWAERSLEGVVGTLRGLGVTLLLSAGKQSEAALAAARRAGISVVECVDEEELSLFAELSGARPAFECWRIGPEHVAELSFCRPVVLGAHSYVQVAFSAPEERGAVRPHSLVVCGAGEGQVEQCARAVRDALRTLLAAEDDSGTSLRPHRLRPPNVETHATTTTTTICTDGASSPREGVWDSRCVLPAGGAFEFLLHRALLQHSQARCSPTPPPPPGRESGVTAVCQLLADALLSIPRLLYCHRPRDFLQARRLSFAMCCRSSTSLCSGLHQGGGGGECSVPVAAGQQSHGLFSDGRSTSDAGLESVVCKYQLILAVLQCLCSVLRVDAVLQVHKTPHTKASPDTDDDDDDEDML
ncbi:hypothetical protein NHX12_002480 [Muraenolepis orangiensis]|uniref:Bardet-Biedl syndrome 10 n=1 Tax=Muraenolepis orangiensis TaxID=630683 RepID=A0A9Q0DYJ4_9TELE|nr:hypothetical protein NHX12_002480 [Muraenolepis orangiensis]